MPTSSQRSSTAARACEVRHQREHRRAPALAGPPELLAGLVASDPVANGSPVWFPTSCSPQAWAAASPVLVLRTVLGLEVDRPAGVVHLLPHVPHSWLPLTLHQIRSGGERLLVRAVSSGQADVLGLPSGVVLDRGPLFVD